MIGIDIKEQVEYIVKKDRDSDKPTIFVLKPLTASDFIKIHSGAIDNNNSNNTKQALSCIIPTVLAGIKAIKNIWNSKEQKGIDIDNVTLADIDKIPLDILTELYTEIMRLNTMSGEETKN